MSEYNYIYQTTLLLLRLDLLCVNYSNIYIYWPDDIKTCYFLSIFPFWGLGYFLSFFRGFNKFVLSSRNLDNVCDQRLTGQIPGDPLVYFLTIKMGPIRVAWSSGHQNCLSTRRPWLIYHSPKHFSEVPWLHSFQMPFIMVNQHSLKSSRGCSEGKATTMFKHSCHLPYVERIPLRRLYPL